MSVSVRACVVVVLLVSSCAEARAAEIATPTPLAVPSEDRRALDDLAPPSDPSTAKGSYGDAAFVRPGRRLRRRPETGLGERRPCFANRAGTPYMRCSESGSAFFRRAYVYTPSFVSAPQVLAPAPSGRTSLLSPFTAFFLNPFDQNDPSGQP